MKNSISQRARSFLDRSRLAHGGRYDYSRADYVNAHTKVSIVCPDHGEFLQLPCHHVKGAGCPECAKPLMARRVDFDVFVARANEVHGGAYRYDPETYKAHKVPTRIECPNHGYFYQQPQHHVAGSGCKSCSSYGFDRSAEVELYVLVSECGGLLKIGVTGKFAQRIAQLRKATPFAFIEYHRFSMPGDVVEALERYALSLFQPAGFQGFSGATEWRAYDPETLAGVMRLFGYQTEKLYFED